MVITKWPVNILSKMMPSCASLRSVGVMKVIEDAPAIKLRARSCHNMVF